MGNTLIIDGLGEGGTLVCSRPFSLMIKPVGGSCNLDCSYCYYRGLHGWGLLSMRQLESVFINYEASQPPGIPLTFIWHGGEPLLAGENYFREAVALQKELFAGKREFENVLQSNAVLMTESLADFLAGNGFLCGVSVDGPEYLHDISRRTLSGKGSWKMAVNGIKMLAAAGARINAMVAVGKHNVAHPAEVYCFLKDIGLEYIQLLPVAEGPSGRLEGEEWGDFLCAVFDLWRSSDIGRVFVNYFDNTLALHAGLRPDMCVLARECPPCPSIETCGDIYACDHLSRPLHGNIFAVPLADVMSSSHEQAHETGKFLSLSEECRSCPYLRLCNGDCPVHRTARTEKGEGISSLCISYRKYFAYTYGFFSEWASSIAPVP